MLISCRRRVGGILGMLLRHKLRLLVVLELLRRVLHWLRSSRRLLLIICKWLLLILHGPGLPVVWR